MLKRRRRRRAREYRRRLRERFRRPPQPTIEPIGSKYRHLLEPLEQRVLLTTLVGGDAFEFRAPDPTNPDSEGPTVRVVVSGDTIVELISADIDISSDPENQELLLGDVPGRIFSARESFDPVFERIGGLTGRILTDFENGVDVLGGVGGEDGVIPVTLIDNPGAGTPIIDPDNPNFNIPQSNEGNDNLALQALADLDLLGNGSTYAFNVGSVNINDENRTLVQLISLDAEGETPDLRAEGTVEAILQQATLSEDIAAQLTQSIGTVTAFAVDSTTGLSYAVANNSLLTINRNSGLVTVIGDIANASLAFEEFTAPGTVSDNISGYTSDDTGLFYSLFTENVVNDTLLQSESPFNPSVVQAVNGELGNQFDVTAMTVSPDPDDPAFAIADVGGNMLLLQIDRDTDGSVNEDGAETVGFITDVQGNAVTNIFALDMNANGQLAAVGNRPDAVGDTAELFLIDPDTAIATPINIVLFQDESLTDPLNGLAFNSAGDLFGVIRADDTDFLIQLLTDVVRSPSESVVRTDQGTVSRDLTGLSSDENGQFFSVFDDDLLNNALFVSDDVTPAATIGGDLGGDFETLGLTVNPDDDLLMVDASGPALDLVRIERLTGSIDGTTDLGTITDTASGTAVMGIQAVDAHPVTGELFAVGFTADQAAPTIDLGDVGGLDILAVAFNTDTGSALAIADAGGTLELHEITFDGSGQIDTITSRGTLTHGVADLVSASSLAYDAQEQRLLTVATSGTDELLTLFAVDPANAQATQVGRMTTGTVPFDSDANQVVGLTILSGSVFGALRSGDETVSVDRLITIDTITNAQGEVAVDNTFGQIQVMDQGASVSGLAVDADGNLLTIGEHGGTTSLISVDTLAAGESRALSDASADLVGMAVNDAGRVHGFNSATGQLQAAAELVQQLFMIDGQGQATIIAPLADNAAPGNDVTSPVTALAFDPTGTMLFAALGQDDSSLIMLDPADGTFDDRGQIVANAATTHVSAMDAQVDDQGVTRFVAFNDASFAGRNIIQVDTTDPDNSRQLTVPGSLPDGVNGYASDANGRFFSIDNVPDENQVLTISENPLAAVNGDFGDNFNFIAATVGPDASDPAFAVDQDPVSGILELHRINRLENGSVDPDAPITNLGEITDALGNRISNINAIDSVPSDAEQLFVVGLNEGAPIPTTTVGGDFGEDFDVVAFTVTDTGRLFAVVRNDNDTPGDDTAAAADDFFELFEVIRTDDGRVDSFVHIGVIEDAVGRNVLNVTTIETNPLTGEVLIIGSRDADGIAGNIEDGRRELFEIDINSGIAIPIAPVTLDGASVTTDVFGLAIRLESTTTQIVVEVDADAPDQPQVPQGEGMTVTATQDSQTLSDALLAGGGTGIVVTDFQVQSLSNLSGETSVGTFDNPGGVYDIGDGIIISTGDVLDYESGDNNSSDTSTSYDAEATEEQDLLLDQITGGITNHFDVTRIDITFDVLPGFDSVFFNVVWGSEEFPE
ncbi:MAG: choice-of-anchor L domain-containing protein, partial [Phycisphaeraceae bacterium]|nr:choice-of-anchor L domain-containing protein [Phycisphaeraceae bacterium]